MGQHQYKAQQLITLLEVLESKKVSGTLYLEAEIGTKAQKKAHVLVWQNGRIVFGGSKIPDSESFIKMLQQKLQREWVNTAVSVAVRQTANQASLQSLLERLVEMQLFTKEQIETVVHNQIILTLEQVLPHPGQFQFDSTTHFYACQGVELSQLKSDLAVRQEHWLSIKSFIPSIETVPQIQKSVLEKITEPAIRQHLEEWVDGKRSLVAIAEGLGKDPLQIAQSYVKWLQAGWVVIEGSTLPSTKTSLLKILAVDDSPVMQQVIKRALTDYCQVLVASNAMDALNIIYREKISLLLLDVSMPEIDGLEVCRTVRSIPQFRDLPIVMVTARDGFFDKVKGKLAGSTEYLTKPFDAEKLRQTVGKYLNVEATVNA